ncbi:MAG: alpha/beta hydrolase [Armatimonadetes bacterium]|nr:alpha/beta hydrolase [Armatimonadota bacterium]
MMILIHGGAFMMSSEEDEDTPLFLKEGYVVASLEYRLSQPALFLAQIEACKAVIRWLRAHAGEYGLDPKHFGAMGHSAGRYLVALLGVIGGVKRFDAGVYPVVSSRAQAVADCFGPTEFLQMDAHRPPGEQIHDAADSPESRRIGGPIQENAARVSRANPITCVTRSSPPFFIAHGFQDAEADRLTLAFFPGDSSRSGRKARGI